MLGGEPLLADASVRMWAQGKRGRVAQSLVSGLLLPKDVWFSQMASTIPLYGGCYFIYCYYLLFILSLLFAFL